MRIVSRRAIREATVEHSEWGASLNAWYKITRNADWKNFAEVRNLGEIQMLSGASLFSIYAIINAG
jgi:mRNA-degrading endonuclease HigB of HigAB toxin-antitoxin module